MKGVKAIYDNGGKTLDRYTVYYSERFKWGFLHEYTSEGRKIYPCVGMSEDPHWSGGGICQHGSGILGRHNGRRIKFEDLPKDCQEVVRRDLQ